jgi:squalene synthase HpnC
VGVEHYENFPVASVLCPPELRPPITAIYGFARTADDIADEGDATPLQRISTLQAYLAELEAISQGRDPGPRWPQVFVPLRSAVERHTLPIQPLRDLVDAFVQDASNPQYADRLQLLDYCRRSANPVGRLLLHLYRIDDERSLTQSDSICSALQLINFWQDLSVDLPRGRCYPPLADLASHGLTFDQLLAPSDTAAASAQAMVADLCRWARELMVSGAPLARRIPGRAGWELRLVVQGGLRILDKIAAMNHRTLTGRPKLSPMDVPLLCWRALISSP